MCWLKAEEGLAALLQDEERVEGLTALRGFVRKLIAGKLGATHPDVDDLAQATLIKLKSALKELPESSQAYVRTAVTSTLNDYFRKKGRRPVTVSLDDETETGAPRADSLPDRCLSASPTLAADFERLQDPDPRQQQAALGRILKELLGSRVEPYYRAVVQLRYVNGLTWEEIGRYTGEKGNTVYKRFLRYFRKIREPE